MDWGAVAAKIMGSAASDARLVYDGNSVVYETDDGRVVKVYRRDARRQHSTELAVLSLLKEAGAPFPAVLEAGMFEGAHPYLVMARLPGQPLRGVWDEAPTDDRKRIGRHLGRAFCVLHGLPTEAASAVPVARYHTEPLTDMIHSLVEAPNAVRQQLIAALQRIAGDDAPAQRVVCEADMAADHVLVQSVGDKWRLSGLVDFADALLGSPEWDIAAIWFWTLNEDMDAMLAFLEAYDRAGALPVDIGVRCLLAGLEIEGAWWLEEHLHRSPKPATLDDLQRQTMPFLDHLS